MLEAYTLANLQTASDGTIETIPLQATGQVSPPQITVQTFAPGTFSIYRKDPANTSWGTAIATGVTLAATSTWTDSGVAAGTLYEYRFVNTAGTAYGGLYPTGYILTGIQVDRTQPKGHMAVVVASDLPVNLPTEYAQYKADLVADGWVVNEIQVPRAPNYLALGNGALATVTVNSGGVTSVANGALVHITNSSGKVALVNLTVNSSGTITAAAVVGYASYEGGGAGFAVGDALTIPAGGPVTTGTAATLTSTVTSSQTPLTDASLNAGGSGYTNNQTVTVKGQTSGATAQCTLYTTTGGVGPIDYLFATTSQSGFVQGEGLTMTGNTTGMGVGPLTVAALTNGTQFYYAFPNSPGTGYTDGEAGVLTGNQSGKTAQITLSVSGGYITDVTIVSSQNGFINGELLTLSGTTSGSGAPLFTASVSASGPLQSLSVVSGGTGYTNGATVNITYGSAVAQGTLIVSGGAITGVTITSGGSGFTNGGYVSLSGISSGYNLTVAKIDNSETGRPVTVASGGSGYTDNDTVIIKGNSSGVTAVGSIFASSGAITGVSVVLPNTFTVGETLALTPSAGGTGVSASVGASLDNHLLIRSAVQAIYNAYPGQLKNVVLLGRIPVCRSGINDGAGADGHGNEAPYGADAFYAEMLGVIGIDWTDTQDNTSAFSTGYNLPGDKQFDQQKISQININGNGGVELGYGRIDLSNNIQTEVEAERTYFGKLHRYKTADPSFLPGRNVCDRLGYPNVRETELQSMPGVVGMNNVTFTATTDLPTVQGAQDADQLYSTQHGPYLFYFKGDNAPLGGVGGKAVFWTGMQSHWGYWYQNYNNMVLRLAENSFTLDFTWDIWGLRYIYHRMGMGLDAGDMMMQSINNQGFSAGPYTYKFNNTTNGDYSGALYMDQMGDPALRLFMLAPPSNLSVVATSGNPALSWTASTDGTVIGYHVYRAVNANAPFTRLTTTPVTATTYTDASVSSGNYVYMVRAVRLETTGGGTFYNPSLGITQSVKIGVAPAPVSIATTSLPGLFWSTPGSTTLVAQGGIPQYTWAIVAGALPAGLTLSTTGVLSGSPTGIGTFNITAQATDQIGQTASQAFALVVSSNSQVSLYPTATTYTSSQSPTGSYGTTESDSISGYPTTVSETFQRYDLSGVNLNNGFVKATVYLYLTSNTNAGAIALLQGNLIADAADGWVDNGIARRFTSAAASPVAGFTRIHCVGHGFTTGTQVTLAGLTGLSSTTPYAITSIDADDFDIPVTYGNWTYDPANAYATTVSMTYNTRPTTYDPNVPTLTATGTDTPGSVLQMDVTSYVREVLNNFPGKQMGLRFFTTTPQTLAIGSLNSFGGSVPYLVIQTTNAPRIVINSPTMNPAVLLSGSSLAINTTVTPLPARATALMLQWSKISGPGTVAFTNATAASTGTSFSAAGDYVVRLTANDGVAQSYQELTVRVLGNPVLGPTDSMVLRLPFDETSGTTAHDSSGVSPANNGTLAVNPTSNPLPAWSTSAHVGTGALSFAGTGERVDVPDSSTNLLDGMQQLTVSCWMYANALPAYGVFAGLVCKQTGSQASYLVMLNGNTALYFYVNGQRTNSATTFQAGKWYHIVTEFDGTQTVNNLRIYVNGSPDRFATISATSVARYPLTTLRIGAMDATDTTGLNGLLDEVRIYNRILTQSEIQDLYAAVPGNTAPVISLASSSVTGNAGQPFNLGATVTDDGKPVPFTLQWLKASGPGNIAFGTPTAAATTGTASLAGNYVLQLAANDGALTTYANVTASIAQTFTGWTNQYNLSGANALDGANPAGDGVVNLLKYAFGMDPTKATVTGLPVVSELIGSDDGKPHLAITFLRRLNSSAELTYIVQVSDDLLGWDSSGNQVEQVGAAVPTGDGITEQVVVRVKAPLPLDGSVPRKFLRLSITRVVSN